MINTKAVMNLNLLYTLFTINANQYCFKRNGNITHRSMILIFICTFQRGKDVVKESLLKVNEHSLYNEVD